MKKSLFGFSIFSTTKKLRSFFWKRENVLNYNKLTTTTTNQNVFYQDQHPAPVLWRCH